MFKLVEWLKGLLQTARCNLQVRESKYMDPVRCCKVYLHKGCIHVDGMLCEPSQCAERLEYHKILDCRKVTSVK